jgi:hypothetical protein
MNRKIFLSAIAITILGSATILAQGQQQLPPAMSFFVAPNPTGAGNLGGDRRRGSDLSERRAGLGRAQLQPHVARLP